LFAFYIGANFVFERYYPGFAHLRAKARRNPAEVLLTAPSDLDVLLIAPREQRAPLLELGARGGALHRKYKIYLDYVGVAEHYEDRLTEMFPGAYKHLRICALDPYDLALLKLERNIQQDRDDINTWLTLSHWT
jgi:hypothetical protein